MRQFQNEVTNGIKFLQEKGYDLGRLDISKLNLSDCSSCVIGQFTGGFGDKKLRRFGLNLLTAWKYGFSLVCNPNVKPLDTSGGFSSYQYDELTREWILQLTQLRTQPIACLQSFGIVSDDVIGDLNKIFPEGVNYTLERERVK